MKEIRKTFRESGGIVRKDDDVFSDLGLSKFEAIKFILSAKLDCIRSEISAINNENCVQDILKKQRVRNLIRGGMLDLRKLRIELKTMERPPSRIIIETPRLSKEVLNKRKNEIFICEQHVEEVKLLYRAKCYDTKSSPSYQVVEKSKDHQLYELIGESEDEFAEVTEPEGYEVVANTSPPFWVLAKDINTLNSALSLEKGTSLPPIDTYMTKIKIQKNRQQVMRKLEEADDRVFVLGLRSELISRSMEEVDGFLDEIGEDLVEHSKHVELVNARLQETTASISTRTKVFLIGVIVVVIIFALVILYVILLGCGLVPGGFRIN